MTDEAVAAVCVRFGIKTWRRPASGADRVARGLWMADDRRDGEVADPFSGTTQADAVCALLTARLPCVTDLRPGVLPEDLADIWVARHQPTGYPNAWGVTELDAVVSLTDQMAARTP